VQARLAGMRPSLLNRLSGYVEQVGEQVGAALALTSLAVVSAVAVAVLIIPGWRHTLSGPETATLPGGVAVGLHNQVAADIHNQVAADFMARAESVGQQVEIPALNSLNYESRAIISRLETADPAVAVWSEPQQDTTVIWLAPQR
jgi:hypothetical protein